MTRLSRRHLLGGVSTALIPLSGCSVPSVEQEETRSETFSVAADALAVIGRNGSVSVESHAGDDVELTVTKRAHRDPPRFDRATVERRTTDGVHEVRVVTRDDPTPPLVVDLTLRVPADLPVSRAETANGSVDLYGTTGDATVRAGNGSVDARNVDGYLTLETGNGRITARNVQGIDDARTSNGGLELDLLDVRQSVRLSAGNGSVELGVASGLAADFDVEVGNGTIDVQGLSFEDLHRTRRRLTGSLNGGGETVGVRVSNGSVDLFGI